MKQQNSSLLHYLKMSFNYEDTTTEQESTYVQTNLIRDLTRRLVHMFKQLLFVASMKKPSPRFNSHNFNRSTSRGT